MTTRWWPRGWSTLCLLIWLLPVTANATAAPAVATTAGEQPKSAYQWLVDMNQAFVGLNFKLPMIHLQRNSIQTYSFEHGIVDGRQVVHVDYLSGPARQSYRVDNRVTYVDAEFPPYSVQSPRIVAPIPSKFVGDLASLAQNYRFVLAGQGRVAGRIAQLIRLSARDEHRFSYLLWLDQQSSLLLRYDVLDLNNTVVEQMQALQLHVFDGPTEVVRQLAQQQTEDHALAPVSATDSRWTLTWLPPGFEVVAADRHRLMSTREGVDYLQLSDGLTQVSVYVALAKDQPLPEQVVTAGGTAMANFRQGQLDITVVGKIPANTAIKLSRSLTLNDETVR